MPSLNHRLLQCDMVQIKLPKNSFLLAQGHTWQICLTRRDWLVLVLFMRQLVCFVTPLQHMFPICSFNAPSLHISGIFASSSCSLHYEILEVWCMKLVSSGRSSLKRTNLMFCQGKLLELLCGILGRRRTWDTFSMKKLSRVVVFRRLHEDINVLLETCNWKTWNDTNNISVMQKWELPMR